MGRGQLWLLPPPQPLVERLGKDFFRQLPPRPGVYLMCGAGEGVLYVGCARNLKKRLQSYRVANPERFPRRVIRLMNRVRRIEYDVCATETAACEREALLITVLAPPFNRAGKVWLEHNFPAGRAFRHLTCNAIPKTLRARSSPSGEGSAGETSGPRERAA